jgi:shikimate kinase
MRIFVLGFMGAGKSFLGKVLAERLGYNFVDLDEMIEAKMAMPIPSIFQQLGEPAFRIIEAECLRGTAQHERLVVATGGGTPCFLDNLDWMNDNGITVYFSASSKLLAERLLTEKANRPLIAELPNDELDSFIAAKLSERAPFYERSHLKFLVPENGKVGIDELSNYFKRIII